MSKNRGKYFIHLNVNSLLPKIDEIHNLVGLTNPSVIGISKRKLDGSVLNSEAIIEDYDITRLDRSGRRGGVACFIKDTVTYCYKANVCLNTGLQPKSTLLVVLIKSLVNSVHSKPKNVIFRDFNINLLYKDEKIFSNKIPKTPYKEMPPLTKKYLEFCFSFYLKQITRHQLGLLIEQQHLLIIY